MSKFPDWFKRAYKQWSRSQPGEEDFLAFCDLLGYSPAIVLNWLQGDSIPQGAELLSIAGLFGTKVHSLLDQPEPDPELVKIYNSFSHLSGESRSKLALALWEAQTEMSQKGVTASSEEAKSILYEAFKKWGFEASSNK
jgi:transcriptional regulator with XRE-family HTH domain